MAGNPKIGVYTLDTFDIANPSPSQQAAMLGEAVALAASDFNVVMLASMHVHDDGSMYFNDTPMINSSPPTPSGQLSPNLPLCFDTIMSKGTILASFGGGGTFKDGKSVSYWDFTAIKNLIAQYPDPATNPFFQNLSCMFETYPQIRGIDIDLECYPPGTDYALFTSTLLTIIEWLGGKGYACTLCPYNYPGYWVSLIGKAGGAGQFSWINLQNASGTASEFVGPLKGAGVAVGQIVGGLQVGKNEQQLVTENFASLAQQYPGIGGGWLWNLESFGTANTASYAAALAKGLAGG